MNTIKLFFEDLENGLDDAGDVENVEDYSCLIKVKNDERVRKIIHQHCRNMEMEYSIEETKPHYLKINISYNACFVCKTNMGLNNPRQYCKKYYCPLMLDS